MLIFCWDGRFQGSGFGSRAQKQRVYLAFFVKTDYIIKKKNVGIFVLNGGNIFFKLPTGDKLLDTNRSVR